LYISSARQIYERGVEYFGDEHISEDLFVCFAKFEEAQKEASSLYISCVLDNYINGSAAFFIRHTSVSKLLCYCVKGHSHIREAMPRGGRECKRVQQRLKMVMRGGAARYR